MRNRVLAFAGIAALAIAASIPLLAGSGYLASVGTQIAIHATIAVGLGLLMGYAGQISLGHAAFYGLGAYASAVLTTRFGVPPPLAMVAGLIVTGIVALIVGAPALRLHGHYLAMFTLGLGIIARIVFEKAKPLTNGFDGIPQIPDFHIWVIHFDTNAKAYVLVVAVLLAMVVLARNVVDSRKGRALRALHESEDAARACGIDVARAKLEIFVLSALMASVAGSMYAHTLNFVSPDPFGFRFSVHLVVMIVVGGAASVWGPVIGAALFTILHQFLQHVGERISFVDDLDTVLFGLVLVVVVVFWRQGLVSLRLPWLVRIADSRATEGGGD